MEVVVTSGAIRCAKLQSNRRHQHPTSLQTGCPSCCLTNSVRVLKENFSHSKDLLTQAHLEVFQLCLWPLMAHGCLGGWLTCLSSALWCQYTTNLAYQSNYQGIIRLSSGRRGSSESQECIRHAKFRITQWTASSVHQVLYEVTTVWRYRN